MFYLIIGIDILFLVLLIVSDGCFDAEDFKIIFIGGIFLGISLFPALDNWLRLSEPEFIQSDTAVYKLIEYDDREYFIKEDFELFPDRIKVQFLNDGFLEEEEFESDIVKTKISDNPNEQPTIEIIKEKKVEPSIFEKIFFFKGCFDDEEQPRSVVLSLPSDSKLPNK